MKEINQYQYQYYYDYKKPMDIITKPDRKTGADATYFTKPDHNLQKRIIRAKLDHFWYLHLQHWITNRIIWMLDYDWSATEPRGTATAKSSTLQRDSQTWRCCPPPATKVQVCPTSDGLGCKVNQTQSCDLCGADRFLKAISCVQL